MLLLRGSRLSGFYACLAWFSLACCAEHPVFSGCSPVKLVVPAQITALQRDWFLLPLAPAKVGFRPLYLPFAVRDAAKTAGGSAQALTFPSLLAFKFDLAPNELLPPYATPLFAFRKIPASTRFTATSPGAAALAKEMGCTHIFGGTLVISRAGYAGTLFALDPSLKSVYRKTYATPMPYFTLMGTMVQDWLRAHGQSVPTALGTELQRPMTSDMKNIALLGTAFTKRWRSREEFAVYDQILKNDPDFGEIRWWAANQRGWTDDFTPDIAAEIARAFLHHPVIHAMIEFSPTEMTDQPLREQAAARWKAHFARLPDHLMLYGYKLVYGGYLIGTAFSEMEKTGMPLYRAYPYNEQLGYGLAEGFTFCGEYQFAIPLAMNTASIDDPTATFRTKSLLLAAMDWWALGDSGAAIACVRQLTNAEDAETVDSAVGLWLTILRSNLCFDEAVSTGMAWFKKVKGPGILMHTLLAAHEGGLEAKVEPLLAEVHVLDNRRLAAGLLAWPELKTRVKVPPELTELTGFLVAGFEADGRRRFVPGNMDAGEVTIQRAMESYTWKDNILWPMESELGAFNIWLLMPRAPYFAHLYRQRCVNTKRPRDLYMYASLLAWLRPDEPYWTALREYAVQQGGEWHPDAGAIHAEIAAGVAPKSEKFSFRHYSATCRPLVMEYLLLEAARQHDLPLLDEVSTLYLRYLGHFHGSSTPFVIHSWDFVNRVAPLLPDDRRKTLLADALAWLRYEKFERLD